MNFIEIISILKLQGTSQRERVFEIRVGRPQPESSQVMIRGNGGDVRNSCRPRQSTLQVAQAQVNQGFVYPPIDLYAKS